MWPQVLSAEAERALKPKSLFKECARQCPEMIVLPAGRFMMGSPDEEKDRFGDEDPRHEVTIAAPFAVSKTEVTFPEWDACVAAGACARVSDSAGWGRDGRPVINVSWDDAKQYVAWLSRMTGKAYRLLTEAEWEYAARAGSTARFAFGDDEGQLDRHAWYNRNSDNRTQPVGQKLANSFGLHDMHGNVFEWVEDTWHDGYDGAPADGTPWVQGGDASRRVIRGGSWLDGPPNLRAANRDERPPSTREPFIGFRLARTLKP